MQYMGSKNKISKQLLPIILKNRKIDQWYVEPFVGGCNMIDKVAGNRIGNDINEKLIDMWRALQNGWSPPTIVSKELYYEVKNNQNRYSPELVCFVGILCSFGAKWFGGYAFNSKGENYAARAVRVLEKQVKNLSGVVFTSIDYRNMQIPEKSIVYCDPPYTNTTKYKNGIDYAEFWDWVRKLKHEGQMVYVSEYSAPEDFECLIEIEYKTILDKNKKQPRIERLFI